MPQAVLRGRARTPSVCEVKALRMSVAAFLLLSGCGGLETRTLTIYVHPPIATDLSCIGVVGFDIFATPPGRVSNTLLNAGPVLDPSACQMTTSYAPQRQPDNWSNIEVLGRDGAGTILVQGSQQIHDLPGLDVHVTLRAAVPQQAVLVVDRTQLLKGAALADTTRMVVMGAGKSVPLVDVSRSKAGTYFDVEPAAFTVSSANLGLDKTDDNLPLTIELTTAQSVTTTTNLRAIWNRTAPYYEAK
jgi:hypothetical protein